MSLASDLLTFLETLPCTQGHGAGRPLKLHSWEKKFIRQGFKPKNRVLALSVPKGTGKSTFCAGLAAAGVLTDAPLMKPRAEVLIAASSYQQGRIVFDTALAAIEARLGYKVNARRDLWKSIDSAMACSLTNKETGAKLRVLSSDPKRSHGPAFSLCLGDEPAQWPAATSAAQYASLRSGLGKIEDGRFIALGTLPDSSLDGHWFSDLAHGHGADYAVAYGCGPGPEVNWFDPEIWKASNPAWGYFPELRRSIKAEAEQAKRNPALLPAFRALRLNAGVSDVAVSFLIDLGSWREAEGEADRAGPCLWGLDMGQNLSMSACAAFWPESGRLDCVAALPGQPPLEERERISGTLKTLQAMLDREELILSPGRTVPADWLLKAAQARFEPPVKIISDRWREAEVREGMKEAGISAAWVPRGMGWRDGGEDTRLFQKALLENKITPSPSLLLRFGLARARVVTDPAGNSKLAKKPFDDPAVAAVLAVAEGNRPNAGGYQIG